MKRLTPVVLLLVAACGSNDNNASGADAGGTPDVSMAADVGVTGDTTSAADSTQAAVTTVRIEDLTPAGQGLALDAVQNCNLVGMACVGLVVTASSDSQLDYAGVEDGPNSQDDTCSESTFVRMGGTGNWVELQRSDSAPFDSGSQLNVWTGDSACSLIEAGDKNFTVSIGGAAGEQCAGTCTVTVP
jgi:hypothetical protein